MSSREVLETLKGKPEKWWRFDEIIEEMKPFNIGRISISNCLRSMSEYGEVERRRGDYSKNCFYYRYVKEEGDD